MATARPFFDWTIGAVIPFLLAKDGRLTFEFTKHAHAHVTGRVAR
jgi:hypothetical protein